jgi:Mn-dependent DtxR family transcriptional regulator
MTERVPLSHTEELILGYITRAKQTKRTVWLSEAIEELGINPREAVDGAKRLESLGLLKPKTVE